jgi:hypothetical protein
MTEERAKYLKDYDSKRKRVALSFTYKEYEELQKFSKSYGENPTTFLQKLYFSSRDNRKILTQDTSQELKRLNLLIRNIANNINQIATKNNILASVFNVQRAKEYLKELDKVINNFVRK